MTLVSSIITAAYRESNLIPLVATPNANQETEGLNRLNSLIQSVVGNEAGNGLNEYTINDVVGTYDEESFLTTWIPDNARLMLTLGEAKTYKLDPFPKEGQRVAVVDVGDTLDTYNVTLDGNGRKIEDAATLVLSDEGLSREWLYRSDLGNWVRIATLTTSDELPFPLEFDDYFITMLALRLNPRYGQMLTPESREALARSKKQLTARYNHKQEIESDLNPRGMLADKRVYTSFDGDEFTTGRAHLWR